MLQAPPFQHKVFARHLLLQRHISTKLSMLSHIHLLGLLSQRYCTSLTPQRYECVLPAAADPCLDSDLGHTLTGAAGPHWDLPAEHSLTAAAATDLTSLVYLSRTVARSSLLWVGKPVSET